MKKTLKLAACAAAMLGILACNKYDDSELSGRVDDLENRMDKLEQLVADLNTNVNSLTKLVKALQEENRIERIEQIPGGYKIILADGKGELTVKNGEKPSVGIVLGEDDVYYWTVDGEPMLSGGEPVPATIAPEFKVEGGQFWFRVNGGEWVPVAGSDSGIGLIKDIVESEESVTFILSEGGEIVIPKVQTFRLNIEASEAGIAPYGSVSIPYTVTAGDAQTKVVAFVGDGLTAKVSGNSQNGTISVYAQETVPASTDMVVMAVNGKGEQSSKVITFEKGVFKVAKDTYTIGAQGGTVDVEIETNLVYNVMTDPDPANSWLSYVPASKAAHKEYVTLTAEEYIGGEAPRSASVMILYGQDTQIITVTQLHTNVASGGSADLDTFSQAVHARNINASGTSAAGWTFENCLIYGPTQWDAIATKTVVLSGSTSKIGSLTSPSLEGGCGTLSIIYGGHIAPTSHRIKFKAEVKNASGETVKTETIGTEDGMYEQKKKYEINIDVNIPGTFSVVLTNLCPSNGALSIGPKDAVTLLSVSWTGYSE